MTDPVLLRGIVHRPADDEEIPMSRYGEDELIAEAEGILGDGQSVVAAGYFGLRDLISAQIAGGTVGSVAGGLASDGPFAAGLGAGLGGAAAVKAYAESQGVTVQMVVAVTADAIHVLNRNTAGRLADRVATFDRHAAHVVVTKRGLSRIVEISDTSGARITLEGSASPISQLAKGDKAVLAELVT